MPGLGFKSYAQIGKETVYGTGVNAAKKFEIISFNVQPVIGVIQDNSLNNAPSRRGIYEGGKIYRGSFVTRLNYEGLEELFRAVMGGAGYTFGSSTHTYIEAADLFFYTMEVVIGDVPTAKCFDLYGVKFTGVTIRGTAGQGADAMVTAEWSIIAKDMVSDQTPTSLGAFPAVYPVIYHSWASGSAVVDDGTADAAGSVRVRSFEVTIENPHADDRFYVSSMNIDEPLRNDFLSVKWRLTQEFTTKTQFDLARTWAAAASEPSPRLKFISQGGTARTFDIESRATQITEFSAPVEGYGVVMSTVTYEAFYSAAILSTVKIILVNTVGTL
jgi:hypothetical protein